MINSHHVLPCILHLIDWNDLHGNMVLASWPLLLIGLSGNVSGKLTEVRWVDLLVHHGKGAWCLIVSLSRLMVVHLRDRHD